jgi:hypothetical protein
MQSRKEAFLAAGRNRQADDYLRSTREAPLSRYEIKAGWEIPAVLEQSLNSDLPGELKALVTSNVYDTATGLYLLIPQGSRLIGKYDSRFLRAGRRASRLEPHHLPRRFLGRSRRHDGPRFPRQRRAAGQSRSPLSPNSWILSSHEHVHRRVRDLPEKQPKRSHVPNASSDRWKRGRPGTQPNRRSDHPAQPECATHDQGPGRVQVHSARKPRHPVSKLRTSRSNRKVASPTDTGKVSVEMSKYSHQIREFARGVGRRREPCLRKIVLACALTMAFQAGNGESTI